MYRRLPYGAYRDWTYSCPARAMQVGRRSYGREGEPPQVLCDALVQRLLVLVGGLVLDVSVDVGGGTTCSLTRRVVDVSVDGGVCDADVQDRFALGEQADGREIALALGPFARPPQLARLRGRNVEAVVDEEASKR